MTTDEATEIMGMLKGAWPKMYLEDHGKTAWTQYLEEQDFDEAMRVYRALIRERNDPPAISDFHRELNGDLQHRFKCPQCGIGWPSQERCDEHFENVHA